jgi:hypothetical protein
MFAPGVERLSTSDRLVPLVLGALALLAAAIPLTAALRMSAHADFDLYYYGGVAERSGTFTDTPRVLALAHEAGARPTESDVYGSPALVALVFQPLSLLPLRVAQRLFIAVAALLAGVATWAAATRWRPAWVALVMCASGTLFGLALGQASLVTLALVFGGFAALRADRQVRAGVLLGIAAALKLYPAFLIVALIAHRLRPAVIAWIATVAALGVCTAVALGPHDVRPAVERTRDVSGSVDGTRQNQSVPALVQRLAGDDAAGTAALVLPIAAAALVVAVARRHRDPARTLAMAAVAGLLAQSISWEHYVPLALIGPLALTSGRLPPRWSPRAVVVGLVAVAGTALAIGPRFYDDLPVTSRWWTLAAAPRTFGMACVVVAMWLWRGDTGDATPEPVVRH